MEIISSFSMPKRRECPQTSTPRGEKVISFELFVQFSKLPSTPLVQWSVKRYYFILM